MKLTSICDVGAGRAFARKVTAVVLAATCAAAVQARGVDEFTIGLEEEVSDGVPGEGAGNIEEPGSLDVYHLTVDAGTEAYFDELWTNNNNLWWQCEDPNQALIFESQYGWDDPGRITLYESGTYTITVYGADDATGQYGFIVWEVDAPDVFVIGLEEEVYEDYPGPGAGSIEEPAAIDIYTFTISAGTDVYFDELGTSNNNLWWQCEDPNQALIFESQYGWDDPGRIALSESGTYTITVYGADDATGQYGFIVWEVDAPDVFVIGLEEEVYEDYPGPGAGSIEEPAAMDIYTFDVDAGTLVCFEELWTSSNNLWWQCEAPDESLLFESQFGWDSPGRMKLPQAGTYTITVYGSEDHVGTYSFIVHEGRPADVTGDCHVNIDDVFAVLGAWGPCDDPDNCPADVNGDSQVNIDDLFAVLADWD